MSYQIILKKFKLHLLFPPMRLLLLDRYEHRPVNKVLQLLQKRKQRKQAKAIRYYRQIHCAVTIRFNWQQTRSFSKLGLQAKRNIAQDRNN